jgi:hypothetical protein
VLGDPVGEPTRAFLHSGQRRHAPIRSQLST